MTGWYFSKMLVRRMEKYIWLDVTTVLDWHRPAVGIIRVETELAAYFLDCGMHQIRFCRFDLANKQYHEVSPQQVESALTRIRLGQSISTSEPSTPQKQKISRQIIKKVILKIINLFPKENRAGLIEFFAKRVSGFSSLMGALQAMRTSIREIISPVSPRSPNENLPRNPDVPFQENDVYISVGLDWKYKDLQFLYAAKRRNNFKVLGMCYDVIPVKFPHLFYGDVASAFTHYFADLAWCADEVFCISECTKTDLTSLLVELGIPSPKMTVIKLGCELPAVSHQRSDEVKLLENSRFIMMVSTIERRKNHEVLYRAYTRLIDKGFKDLPILVFVGMLGWGVNDLLSDLQLDSRIKPYIRILNHVTDGDLIWLYQNSLFTVFPSLYEGWGIPVAESLAAGKFCLASNAASIPEVGGDLVEYIDPWDLPAWVERLEWYFSHPQELTARNERCSKEYITPTWKETASFILAAAHRWQNGDAVQ